ncbi:hypothetical protein EYF80_066369 [Liparis tanakae]
MEGLR